MFFAKLETANPSENEAVESIVEPTGVIFFLSKWSNNK